ncbi:MAG: hypothetical protein GTO55_06535 [Armatimonadetes bacterium]|nr:hypothetical protein [Armatimonadota bacterium]NIM23940.1 hypothetical protein [Armatimonadota bacterium]NIM67787.1 hypothetical protein [Armatimonadota bacterium]NIM76327.1 hypothetical protein [Armatimonadota bacterium]NIN06021.1 hypothetical protein [Armatimonadota bacterium]
MNEVDVVIVLVVGLSVYHGAARGVLIGAIDLFSILLALTIGSLIWRVAAVILKAIGFPEFLSGLLGFMLVSVGVAVGVVYLGSLLVRDLELGKWPDRIGGGISGLLFGLLLSALLLMISGVLPHPRESMLRSALGPRIISLVPTSYSALERAGIALPKLVVLPLDYRDELKGVRRGPQFLQINFSKLDGMTCMKCRSAVDFQGYRFQRGTLISPKFQCPNCGRTTDGCQTFEGFHRIYDQCPVELAREGVKFDCGVWTNGDFILPKGPCPIDGNELKKGRHASQGPAVTSTAASGMR